MRYPKGYIQLNQSRDLPLLREILRSQFVTHSQLFEFMQLNHYERSRKWLVRECRFFNLVERPSVLLGPGNWLVQPGTAPSSCPDP